MWAADCADRVLGLFEAECSTDGRPRDAIERTRAFANGDLNTAEGIHGRFGDGSTIVAGRSPAAIAAARAAGQASAVCHMGAHALGAAAYAADAKRQAAGGAAEKGEQEICWQLDHMRSDVREALRTLPLLGEDRSGPLGMGLLTRGYVRTAIEALQHAIAETR